MAASIHQAGDIQINIIVGTIHERGRQNHNFVTVTEEHSLLDLISRISDGYTIVPASGICLKMSSNSYTMGVMGKKIQSLSKNRLKKCSIS